MSPQNEPESNFEELEAQMVQLDKDGPPPPEERPEEPIEAEPAEEVVEEGGEEPEAAEVGTDNTPEPEFVMPPEYGQEPQADLQNVRMQKQMEKMESQYRKLASTMGNKIALLERALRAEQSGLEDRRPPQPDVGLADDQSLVGEDQRDQYEDRFRAMERQQIVSDEERRLLSTNPGLEGTPRWQYMMGYLNQNSARITNEGDAGLFRQELRSLLYEATTAYDRQGKPKGQPNKLAKDKQLASPAGASPSRRGTERRSKDPRDMTFEELEKIMEAQDRELRRSAPRSRR